MTVNKNNIVLIGMPGCGKTTIGKIISQKLNKKFIDSDTLIEESYSGGIKALFEKGEMFFRDEEEKIISKISTLQNAIVSTGGGVILRDKNIKNLKKNGKIVFIDRDILDIINDVDTNNRPLLKDGANKLFELHKSRYDLYKKYCDLHIINDSSIEKLVDKIITEINK